MSGIGYTVGFCVDKDIYKEGGGFIAIAEKENDLQEVDACVNMDTDIYEDTKEIHESCFWKWKLCNNEFSVKRNGQETEGIL